MPKENRTEQIELEKRIHEISLLMRRKSTKFIIEYIIATYNVSQAQAFVYIHKAREEWKKYFLNLKKAGMSYYTGQLRDLKDIAWENKDYKLVFEIIKDEEKLGGIYPASKFEVTEKKVVVIGEDEEEKKDDDK